jgi:iron(III) transport system permease protein
VRAWSSLLGDGASVLILLVAILLLFSLLPFGRLALAALAPGRAFDPAPALAEIGGRAGLAAAWHSVETSVASAAIALLLGTGVALALVLTDAPGKRWVALLFVASMLIAPQVTALAFLTMAGPSSALLNTFGLAPPPGSENPLLSREGIIAVLGLHHAPLVFVTVRAGLRTLPRDALEAARVSGAGAGRVLRTVVLPLLGPHLVAAGALAFVAAIGNFGIPALLGMPANYLTLPTLIYRRLTSFGPSVIADAAALSLAVAALAGAGVLLAALALRARPARFGRGAPVDAFWGLGRWRLPVATLLWSVAAIALLLPLASLLASALVPTTGVPLTFRTVTAQNFVEVLWRQAVTARALRNSFLFAFAAALVLALLAVPLAHTLDRRLGRMRRPAEVLLEIPYALPGVVLAIACILLFLRPLPVLGVSLYGTPFIILFAYLARFLPMALKAPAAAVAQLPPDQEEAARICGARFGRRLRTIVLPAVAPAAAAGGLLVFLTAFNELTVSALLWSAGTETVGVALFSLEEAGLASEAAAVAVTASALVAAVMLGLDRMAGRLPPGVLPWRV